VFWCASKCALTGWKVREIEFLGVVIGPKGVEMQKKKVEEVLS